MPKRILILSKRRYMTRDLISDRFGRFREIALELSSQGHEVRGIAFSYSEKPEGETCDQDARGVVRWRSVNLGRAVLPGLLGHWNAMRREAMSFGPDIVLAVSDAYHAISGVALARSIGARAVVDLYDNFESYAGTKLPPVFAMFKRAVRKADLVTCVSPALARHVRQRYGRSGAIEVLPNGVRADLFHPGDRFAARRRLGLPHNFRLVGIAGAIQSSRDVETLFRATDILARDDSSIALVAAGPRDPDLTWPLTAKVFDLGVVDHARVADVIRAADLMVVPNRASQFGNFCHPQKACEALACGVPVVAAKTGSVAEFLGGFPYSLYEVGNVEELATVLRLRLTEALGPQQAEVLDWSGVTGILAQWL